MIEWFLKSIGVADEMVEDIHQATLGFQRPGWLWALLLVVPVGIFIYLRQRKNLATIRPVFRLTLTITRVLILVVLLLVLAGPILKIDHEDLKKPIVALVFDTSQSMRLPAGPFESDEELASLARAAGYDVDDEGGVDAEVRRALIRIGRSELAQSVVKASTESLLGPLEKDYELRVYAFGRGITPVSLEDSDDESATLSAGSETATHLGEAIAGVLEHAAGQRISAILLFSDGQNTGGRSPAAAAAAAAEYRTEGVPIYAVPVGSARRMQDVSIIDVYTSGLVAVGDTVRVHVTLESQGFDGRPVKVQLTDADSGKSLDEREIPLIGAEQQQVVLSFEATEAGARYLSVAVPEQPGESDELKANNSDTAFVRITEEKLKVLLIDGFARWDFRFLKNAIRRDNGLAGRVSQTDPEVVLEVEWRRWSPEQQLAMLPQTIEETAEYHVIILGDVSPDLLDEPLQQRIIEAVRDKGVGLLIAAGTESMPHRFGEEFQELLPVELVPDTAGQEAPVFRPFRLEISPDGVIHEAMRLYDDPGRNQVVWSRMPPYYWCASVLRPAAGATVLAVNPSVRVPHGKMPLIAYHYAGDGKVMFVATDSTWLWRQNVGDRFFYKFWGQSLRFVARRDTSAGKVSWIEVRPIRAQPGEEAKVELMAFAENGTPRTDPTLSVTVAGPQERQTVKLEADPTHQGRYVGRFVPSEQGRHEVAWDDGSENTVRAFINVKVAPEEFRHPQLNIATLEGLAQATGGRLVALPDLGDVPPLLSGQAQLSRRRDQATIWDNWLILIVLVVIYSVDVGIRRMMGLS